MLSKLENFKPTQNLTKNPVKNPIKNPTRTSTKNQTKKNKVLRSFGNNSVKISKIKLPKDIEKV